MHQSESQMGIEPRAGQRMEVLGSELELKQSSRRHLIHNLLLRFDRQTREAQLAFRPCGSCHGVDADGMMDGADGAIVREENLPI